MQRSPRVVVGKNKYTTCVCTLYTEVTSCSSIDTHVKPKVVRLHDDYTPLAERGESGQRPFTCISALYERECMR